MPSGCRALPSGVSGHHMAEPPTTLSSMKAAFPGIYIHIFEKGGCLDVLISLSRMVYTYGDGKELWLKVTLALGRAIGTNEERIGTHTLTDVKGFKHLHHLKDESVAYKLICFVPWTVPHWEQQRTVQTLLFPYFILTKIIMLCMWRISRELIPTFLHSNQRTLKTLFRHQSSNESILRGLRKPLLKLQSDLVELGVLNWWIYLYTG